MSSFRYVATGRDGAKVRGVLQADDLRAAAELLRRRELFPLRLDQAAGDDALADRRRRRGPVAHFRPVVATDKVFFFRQLAVMLRSGVSILQALDICAEQASSGRLERALLGLVSDIRDGASLSESMGRSKVFSNYMICMVESAEASGELDRVCEELASHIERTANTSISLVTSLAYPAFVFLGSLFVAGFLVLNVLPTIARVLTRRGLTLRWPAQTLVSLSEFVQANALVLAITPLVIAAFFIIWLSLESGRRQAGAIILRIPIIGPLFQSATVSRLSRTMSMLLESGISALEALRVTAAVISNPAIRIRVLRAADEVLSGNPIASSMQTKLLPRLLFSVIAVGEKTGALPTVLREVADFYDQDLARRVRRLAVFAEPAILAIVGFMVGFVYYALIDAILFAQVSSR